eukprot:c14464_g1_i1.p1 GENE.c14464_g1_i1~~c14464_g1_i1.p1  ORF type:complete len:493 (+),score=57.82 c14464_g1_i1:22-1479(+)
MSNLRFVLLCVISIFLALLGLFRDVEPPLTIIPSCCSKIRGFLPAVVWYLPVGCDYNGFFVELLGYIVELSSQVTLAIHTGNCAEEMLSTLNPEEARVIRSLQSALPDPVLECCVVVQHVWPHNYRPRHHLQCSSSDGGPRAIYSIGRSMTEEGVLGPADVAATSLVDEIWVPTKFHLEVFRSAGVLVPIHVVPEAVDVDFLSPSQRTIRALALAEANGESELLRIVSASEILGPAEYIARIREASRSSDDQLVVFSSVFKWEARKGWDILLKSFWNAFDPGCDGSLEVDGRPINPVLLLRTYRPNWEPGPQDIGAFVSMTQARICKHSSQARHPKVVWIDRDLTRSEMRDLFWISDAFVLPSRGEGWGLPVAEAMASGTLTICTNYSGPTEYANATNSLLLQFTNVHAHIEPSVDHLTSLFRRVAKSRFDPDLSAEFSQLRQNAVNTMSRNFSPRSVVELMTTLIRTAATNMCSQEAGHEHTDL